MTKGIVDYSFLKYNLYILVKYCLKHFHLCILYLIAMVVCFVVRGSQGIYIVTGDGAKKEVIRLVQ